MLLCVFGGWGSLVSLNEQKSKSRVGENGGGCTRKQSSFVLKKSGLTGVRSELQFTRGKKKF